MAWTHDRQVRYLVELPWTVEFVREGARDVVATVQELPFVLACVESKAAATRELRLALWNAMDAMLSHGDTVPLPAGQHLPWADDGAAPSRTPSAGVKRRARAQ